MISSIPHKSIIAFVACFLFACCSSEPPPEKIVEEICDAWDLIACTADSVPRYQFEMSKPTDVMLKEVSALFSNLDSNCNGKVLVRHSHFIDSMRFDIPIIVDLSYFDYKDCPHPSLYCGPRFDVVINDKDRLLYNGEYITLEEVKLERYAFYVDNSGGHGWGHMDSYISWENGASGVIVDSVINEVLLGYLKYSLEMLTKTYGNNQALDCEVIQEFKSKYPLRLRIGEFPYPIGFPFAEAKLN